MGIKKLGQTIIQYRDLIWSLAIKDLKVKYRNPRLGFLWAIIMPLAMVFILKFVFSDFLKARVERYPFFIYLMTAIFPWAYFSASVNASIDCIAGNRELIKKTYFPREVILLAVVLESLINFLLSLLVMLAILFAFTRHFPVWIWFVPLIIILETIFILGVIFLVSSLQVFIRDMKYIVELLLMSLFYLSPTFYSLSTASDCLGRSFKFYLLNPFVGMFILYRSVFLNGYFSTLPGDVSILGITLWTVIVILSVFFIGYYIFKRIEPRFSDLI